MYVVMYILCILFYFARKTKSSINETRPVFSFLPDIVIRREDNVSLYVDIDCIVYTGHWTGIVIQNSSVLLLTPLNTFMDDE